MEQQRLDEGVRRLQRGKKGPSASPPLALVAASTTTTANLGELGGAMAEELRGDGSVAGGLGRASREMDLSLASSWEIRRRRAQREADPLPASLWEVDPSPTGSGEVDPSLEILGDITSELRAGRSITCKLEGGRSIADNELRQGMAHALDVALSRQPSISPISAHRRGHVGRLKLCLVSRRC
uniref:Uncharacterized protein n=1 Tax=Oryza barthii TaxID=65489 RepID=A0A0D3GFH7_9ORYZ